MSVLDDEYDERPDTWWEDLKIWSARHDRIEGTPLILLVLITSSGQAASSWEEKNLSHFTVLGRQRNACDDAPADKKLFLHFSFTFPSLFLHFSFTFLTRLPAACLRLPLSLLWKMQSLLSEPRVIADVNFLSNFRIFQLSLCLCNGQ